MADVPFVRRNHLTRAERYPRYYRDAEKILKAARNHEGNLKTLLYNSNIKRFVLQKVYALSFNVLKNYKIIQRVIEEVSLLEKEPFLRKELAEIFVYELILGKGTLPSESKAVTSVLKHQHDIIKAFQLIERDPVIKNTLTERIYSIPKYARVNSSFTTVTSVISELLECGYQEVKYADNLSQEKYLDLLKDLTTGFFTVDYHFKDLLVFANTENLVALDLYQKGNILLQDKSSYIPVHVLNPLPGSTVIDACAAPGMKTTHLASVMQQKGILCAYELNKKRFGPLKTMLKQNNVEICKAINKDFRMADPADKQNSNVHYILVDPSCSGSGMVNRMDEVTDSKDSKNENRLRKLAGFQIILLKHALQFPSVKRVVYSTCSTNEEENEFVVHEALNAFSEQFKLISVLPEWPTRGFKHYEFGPLCLRSYPDKNLTNGFFVAAFERISSSENILKDAMQEKKERKWYKSDNLVEEPTSVYSKVKLSKNIDTSYCTYDKNSQKNDNSRKKSRQHDNEKIDCYNDLNTSPEKAKSKNENKKRKSYLVEEQIGVYPNISSKQAKTVDSSNNTKSQKICGMKNSSMEIRQNENNEIDCCNDLLKSLEKAKIKKKKKKDKKKQSYLVENEMCVPEVFNRQTKHFDISSYVTKNISQEMSGSEKSSKEIRQNDEEMDSNYDFSTLKSLEKAKKRKKKHKKQSDLVEKEISDPEVLNEQKKNVDILPYVTNKISQEMSISEKSSKEIRQNEEEMDCNNEISTLRSLEKAKKKKKRKKGKKQSDLVEKEISVYPEVFNEQTKKVISSCVSNKISQELRRNKNSKEIRQNVEEMDPNDDLNTLRSFEKAKIKKKKKKSKKKDLVE